MDRTTAKRRQTQRSHRRAMPSKALIELVAGRASPPLRLLIEFAVITAARKQEILRLQWRDVDLLNAAVFFHQRSPHGFRKVPLTIGLTDKLRASSSKHHAHNFVFVNEAGSPLSEQWVSMAFRDLCIRIAEDYADDDLASQIKSLCPNDLRKFAIRQWIANGIPTREVVRRARCSELSAKADGNSDESMSKEAADRDVDL